MEYWEHIYAPLIVIVAGAVVVLVITWLIKLYKDHKKDKKEHRERIESLLTNTWMEVKCTQHALVTVNNGTGEKYKVAMDEHRDLLKPTLKQTWGMHYEYVD